MEEGKPDSAFLRPGARVYKECAGKRMNLLFPPMRLSKDFFKIYRSWSSESQETKKEN